MPTKKVQMNCPNCRTPQVVEAVQVFDAAMEPQSKQRILTGAPNMIQCSACGYQGPVHMPIVYHDPEKQLLLTHVPPELGLPMHEQERVIGPLITKVVDSLPAEKRRAYLLQPRTMLTMQTMVETILEGDGITKEMIESQQERVTLLQRLANLNSDDAIIETAQQEDAKIDSEFFSILNTLVSNALQTGDEALARRLVEIQQKIVPVTTYGKEVQRQNNEVRAAAEELQALGEKLNQESLLDLVIKSSNETRLRAYVSMARQGMDYEFFQKLSERIDRARPDARPRLAELRQQLLELTAQYDAQAAQQMAQMKQLIDALLQEEDPREIIRQNPELVDEMFLAALQDELEAARQSGDFTRSGKIQELVQVIDEMSAPPPEFEMINKLVTAADDEARNKLLDKLSKEQLSAISEMMMNVVAQVESTGDEKTKEIVKSVYRLVLRRSMKMSMQNPSG